MILLYITIHILLKIYIFNKKIIFKNNLSNSFLFFEKCFKVPLLKDHLKSYL